MSVSVVIPTIARSDVFAATQSVLNQTIPVDEVIVVADTAAEFALPDDARVTLIRTGPRAGGNVARQAGIVAASGDLVALLDDDDLWEPTKIARQLALLERSRFDLTTPWISTCRMRMPRPGAKELLQPEFSIKPMERVPEYLFRKKSMRSGHGFIQASTLLFPRWMALEVPFDGSLKFHQDISWLVDISARFADLKVSQVWEPLVVYVSTEGSVSKGIKSADSIQWALNRLSSDPHTLGDFILTQPLGFARREESVSQMLHVIAAGLTKGRPSVSAIGYSLGATAKFVVKQPFSPR